MHWQLLPAAFAIHKYLDKHLSTFLPVQIDQGNTGQLLVTIQPVAKARSYELRYAPVPAAEATVNPTTIVVTGTKPATPINNLTPGTSYTFQVRALGKLGFSDWSSSVERMSI